jgi:pentatricopeptide repeat protein
MISRSTQRPFRVPFSRLSLVLGDRRPFSTAAEETSADVVFSMEQQARTLLREKVPLEASDLLQAKDILEFFKAEKRTDSTSVKLSLQILDKLITTTTRNPTILKEQHNKWLQPKFFHPILTNWKNALRQGVKVIAPRHLLAYIVRRHSVFRFSKIAYGIVTDAIIESTPEAEAPLVAEQLLLDLKDLIKPDEYEMSRLLQAWCRADRPETPRKIAEILDHMRQQNIALDPVICTILLRYFGSAKRKDLDSMEHILRQMPKQKQFVRCLAPAAHGYIQCQHYTQARSLLKTMIVCYKKTPSPELYQAIAETIQTLLGEYRRLVDESKQAPKTPHTQNPNNNKPKNRKRLAEIIEDAETLFEIVVQNDFMEEPDLHKIFSAMLDFQARTGQHDNVLDMFRRIPSTNQKNISNWNILLKSLGKNDMAAQATSILDEILRQQQVQQQQGYSSSSSSPAMRVVTPDIITFNTVIHAWAQSSSKAAPKHALEVFGRMDAHGIAPDAVTFTSLLQCLSRSNSNKAPPQAMAVLEDMEQRYRRDGSTTTTTSTTNLQPPTVVCYLLALRACVRGDDPDCAASVLEKLLERRLDDDDHPIDARTFGTVLHILKQNRHRRFAELAREWHQRLPTSYKTAQTYRMLVEGHASVLANDPSLVDVVWGFYQEMKANLSIVLDRLCYLCFIDAFVRFGRLDMALAMFQEMELNRESVGLPDYKMYNSITKAYLRSGDMEAATRLLIRRIESIVHDKNLNARISLPIIDQILQGWIGRGDLEEASNFLDKIEILAVANGGGIVDAPDKRCYERLLRAWQRSLHPEKERRVQSIRTRLVHAAGAASRSDHSKSGAIASSPIADTRDAHAAAAAAAAAKI